MKYKHTQIGYLIVVVILITCLFFSFILAQTKFNPVTFVIMLLTIFLLVSFVALRVVIDENYLSIKFSYGIYKKHLLLSDIIQAKAVKNRWYHGWGIRVRFWPFMCIYNVSGFDAVEVKMKNGKTYRIGTDEPKKLESMLKQLTEV